MRRVNLNIYIKKADIWRILCDFCTVSIKANHDVVSEVRSIY